MAWLRWYDGTRGRVARVQWRDTKTGGIRTRTLGPVSEEAARIALRDVESRVEGKAPKAEQVASTEALGRFLAFLRVRQRTDATVAYYDRILGAMFKAFGNTPMRLWNRGLLEDYVAEHAATWGPRTIQTRVNAAHHFVGWARASGLDVPDFVNGYRGPDVPAHERPYYTADELRRIIEGAGQPGVPEWVEPAVALCALAGASMGDLYRLTWGEVDLELGWLRSRRSKTHQPWVVKIPPMLDAILRRHRAVGGLVVRGLPKFSASTSHAVRLLFERVGVDATGGLKRLRHSYCTLLGVGLDVDLATGARAMGHAVGSTATLRYMHTSEAALSAAAGVIEAKMRVKM